MFMKKIFVHPLNEPLSSDPHRHCQVQQAIKTPSNLSPALANFDSLPDSAHVRMSEVMQLFGCSRASVWRWTKAKKLPAPKRFGARFLAWNVGDLRIALDIRC